MHASLSNIKTLKTLQMLASVSEPLLRRRPSHVRLGHRLRDACSARLPRRGSAGTRAWAVDQVIFSTALPGE